jgi:Ca-activated chloride channel family protein
MNFVYPQLFFILIVPIAFFAFFILRHEDGFLEIFNRATLERLTVKNDSLSIVARNSILLLALFFMLIALARPVVEKGQQKIQLETLSMIIALDTSASMSHRYGEKNDLDLAKALIASILEQSLKSEISLLTVADRVSLVAPLTSDKYLLKSLLLGIDSLHLGGNRSSSQELIEISNKYLKNRSNKVLVLVSNEEGIRRYSPLMASSPVVQEVLPDNRIEMLKDSDKILLYPLSVAKKGDMMVEKLLEYIYLQNSDISKKEFILYKREELFFYPLGVGILLLLVGFSSFRREL